MSKYTDRAMALREETPRPNCAETMLATFADEIGLPADQLRSFGKHFGHGMKSGSTCGAITGALMVLGALGVNDATIALDLQKLFRETHDGQINCAELMQGNAERGGNRKAFCDSLICSCIDFIEARAGDKLN